MRPESEWRMFLDLVLRMIATLAYAGVIYAMYTIDPHYALLLSVTGLFMLYLKEFINELLAVICILVATGCIAFINPESVYVIIVHLIFYCSVLIKHHYMFNQGCF